MNLVAYFGRQYLDPHARESTASKASPDDYHSYLVPTRCRLVDYPIPEGDDVFLHLPVISG